MESHVWACSAKTSSQLISLDFQVSGHHAASMKILLLITVVQALNMLVFAWFNRTAGLRILVLREHLAVYRRRSKKPLLNNRDPLFWSLLSRIRIWRDWTSEWKTRGHSCAERIASRLPDHGTIAVEPCILTLNLFAECGPIAGNNDSPGVMGDSRSRCDT